MFLFRGLSNGFYHPIFWLLHIPIGCTGYLIRDKAKSPKARRIWIAVFAFLILVGEVACRFWLEGNDLWTPVILLTVLLDLLIGYFSKGFYRIICGAFKALVDWIKKDET